MRKRPDRRGHRWSPLILPKMISRKKRPKTFGFADLVIYLFFWQISWRRLFNELFPFC